MAIKWEAINVGDVLYHTFRQKMGNTCMRQTVSIPVKVVEIDHAAGTVTVSRNSNPPQKSSKFRVTKLRRSPHKPKTPLAVRFGTA